MPYLIYIGDGSGFPDIPARDLSQDEAEKYGVNFLLASKLYIRPKTQTATGKPPVEVKEK